VQQEFTEKFSAAMKRLRIGSGLDPEVELGPMVNKRAIEDIDRLVQDAAGRGSEVVTGGAPLARTGFFYPPTVLSCVPKEATILKNEIFGPVAPIVAFSDDDEAITAANDTEYGLIAYLFTGNLSRGMRVAERLESGMVGVNRGLVSDPAAPFGGVKQSGLGREGSHDGMMEYMEKKYIGVEW
jgi:succinate-semialdehyde dehydrogenase/glutarate-semialdehyde dehydrogenase